MMGVRGEITPTKQCGLEIFSDAPSRRTGGMDGGILYLR